jgi:hypothetical protein
LAPNEDFEYLCVSANFGQDKASDDECQRNDDGTYAGTRYVRMLKFQGVNGYRSVGTGGVRARHSPFEALAHVSHHGLLLVQPLLLFGNVHSCIAR